jgi:YtoQ family protein
MNWNVYLSCEIHSDWREQIIDGAEQLGLDLSFTSAVTKHAASDAAGNVLGAEENSFWRDHKSSKVNCIRAKTMTKNCDIAVICTY